MKVNHDAFVITVWIVILFFCVVAIGINTKKQAVGQHQADQDMVRSVYERVDPQEARDEIFRLMELLSSESYKQADPDVQSSAAATLEEFLLQLGVALEQARQTGKTGYFGLLRAKMRNDKDAAILYRRDLGLLQDGTSKGD